MAEYRYERRHDYEVLCPFFHSKNNRLSTITCEGISDDCITAVKFQNARSFEMFCGKYCCADYKKCSVYKMLNEKY